MKTDISSDMGFFRLACICAAAALLNVTAAFGAHNSENWIVDSLKTVELVNVQVKDSLNAIATVRIGFNNPKGAFEISGINAGLSIDGKECFRVSCDNIIAIEKQCDKTYLADMNISLAEGGNPFRILNILKLRYKPHINLNLSLKVALRGGLGVNLRRSISLDDILRVDTLEAGFLDSPFSISPLPGRFSVRSFDMLYLDEIGPDAFLALLEVGLDSPSVMKASPELGFAGRLKFSGRDAIRFDSVYKLDIKSGHRTYYIQITGKRLDGFNPFELLNLMKNPCRETLSVIFEKPRIADGREVSLFSE